MHEPHFFPTLLAIGDWVGWSLATGDFNGDGYEPIRIIMWRL